VILCHLCPLCLQPYGNHTDVCQAPRREPPPDPLAEVRRRAELQLARILQTWLRPGERYP
jgi:hypothetical protein